jgi:hypothetical protein
MWTSNLRAWSCGALFLLAALVADTAISEDKSSTVGRASPNGPVTKQGTAAANARPSNGDQEKPQGGDLKTQDDGVRAVGEANDYWTSCFGGFHMSGSSGRAVYRFPATSTGTGYDTAWTFVDDYPVGGRQGWTYKEQGYQFYMFFAKTADANGKWWVGYSSNNSTFFFYAWAD